MSAAQDERVSDADFRYTRRWAGGLVMAYGLAVCGGSAIMLVAGVLRPRPTFRIFDHEWGAEAGWRLVVALTVWGAAYALSGLHVLRARRWATDAALVLSLLMALGISAFCGRYQAPLPDGTIWLGCNIVTLLGFRFMQASLATRLSAARPGLPPDG